MRYLAWLVRLLVFALVLLFALNNTTPVEVRFYGAHLLPNVPLVVVMLVTFLGGTVFAALLLAGSLLRRGREIKRLKRALTRQQEKHPPQPMPVASETPPAAPLAPL